MGMFHEHVGAPQSQRITGISARVASFTFGVKPGESDICTGQGPQHSSSGRGQSSTGCNCWKRQCLAYIEENPAGGSKKTG